MSRFVAAFAVGFLLVGLVHAKAGVVVTVNKSTQRLTVAVDGAVRHEWPVSTARWGYRTPNGTYRPERLARKWYSRKYDMSPMPYSIFFHGGYAIHGSYEISHIGRPASHGCIRLLPKNAAVLFRLVSANRGDTRIVVTGERPSYRAVTRRVRREETSARRHRERTVERQRAERRYRERAAERRRAERRQRERVVEQRSRRNRADFEDVFASPPHYGSSHAPYPTWDDQLNNTGQRQLRRWWWGRH